MRNRFLWAGSVGLVLASVFIGCGQSGPKVVRVSGLVTLDGKPLDGAYVHFVSDEFQTTGLTDEEGHYEVRAAPGEYKVAISKTEGGSPVTFSDVDPADDPSVVMVEFENPDPGVEAAGGEAGPKELIPARFSHPGETTLKFTVPEGGSDEADFLNLTSK